MSRMGGFGKSSKTTKTTKITAEKVKIGDKEQVLSEEAIKRITSKSNQEEAITENASKLLREKKSI